MRVQVKVGMGAAIGLLMLLVGPAPARGQCLEAVREYHGSRHIGKSGCLVAKEGRHDEVSRGRTGECGVSAEIYYFEVKAAATEAANQAGAGTPVSRLPIPGCRQLWAVELTPEQAIARGDAADDERRAAIYRASTLAAVFEAYEISGPRPKMLIEGRATGGASDVAGEVLQILGQIVVDRATQAAYARIGNVIRDGLDCDRPDQPDGERRPFPATCEALATLRIQDLAMARTVLVRAMAADLVARAFTGAGLGTPADEKGAADPAVSARIASAAPTIARGTGTTEDDASAAKDAEDLRGLVTPLTSAIIATLADPTRLRHGFTARLIEEEIVSFAFAHKDETREGFLPIVLAGAALLKCTTEFDGDKLAACPVSQLVDHLARDEQSKDLDAVGRSVARSVARGMLAAISATEGTAAEPAPRARLAAAVAGLFDGVCYALKEKACPPILDAGALTGDASIVWLSTARGVIEAAIDEDTNRLIASVAAGAQALHQSKGSAALTPEQRRGLRLLAGVVQYAGTYGQGQPGATDEQKHEQRTKILESLTADMTQRTDRKGDWILSLGGSLGLVGGGRFRSGESIPTSPLALSLGVALQKVDDGGLHLELGIVDLAQYLSFEKETGDTMGGSRSIVVGEPDVEDVLSPSIRIGLQWGRNMPVYVAAMGGYSPFYEFTSADGATAKRGSLNFGITVGAYVPLFDAN
jgi:hypothetical protein